MMYRNKIKEMIKENMKEKCQNYVIDICSQLKLDPLMNLIYRHNKINKIKKVIFVVN